MKTLKVKGHKLFAAFDYESANINTFADLGDILFKENEIGVVIQIHADHDVRVDMWGNCSPGECSAATIEQIKEFRPDLLQHLSLAGKSLWYLEMLLEHAILVRDNFDIQNLKSLIDISYLKPDYTAGAQCIYNVTEAPKSK